ncbi:GNAT family N-acetyltransferase [Lentibacillus salinarum]|uniref:Enhanced intracellular survival protein Eis n=1 Tax=Lentibacillus salinarum TaxID=446820 RepID=A0ABW3ZZG5_9BACI
MADIRRLDVETDADDIFALSQFAFQYELSGDALSKKQVEAKRHIIWGLMDDDRLAAKLHLIPLACYINGKTFDMGGISSVATWPEYRRQGAVKQLLYYALKHMRTNGQTLSFLHPFSFAFYRKYGWEHTFSQKTYTMPIDRLKREWGAKGYVRRMNDDIPALDSIYTAYAKQFNGTLVRDDKWWTQRVLQGKWHQAAAYSTYGQAEGYLLYNVKNGRLTVHELVYNTPNAHKLLLHFIANHDSMVDTVEMAVPENDHLPLLVDEPRFEQTIKPYFMARIVDVQAFLKQYPFLPGSAESVTLHIADPFLPENNGTYQLSHIGPDTNVTHLRTDIHGQAGSIHCGVQQLTSMVTGFSRPLELYNAGLIHGDKYSVEQLENVIPQQQTYFPDFF